jgi:hypothetical protein
MMMMMTVMVMVTMTMTVILLPPKSNTSVWISLSLVKELRRRSSVKTWSCHRGLA